MNSRPDPLAPPDGYGQPREEGPDLQTCSNMITRDEHCHVPSAVIIWGGCLNGEHAGPLGFCSRHGRSFAQYAGMITCAQCGGGLRIMKITDMDGRELALPADERVHAAVREVFGDG